MLFTPTTVTLFAKQEAVKHVLAVHTSAIRQLKHATDTNMRSLPSLCIACTYRLFHRKCTRRCHAFIPWGWRVFSSPEPTAQGELLWSLTVRRSPFVRPSTIFKQHLLLNHWLDFDQTSKEWSLVGPLSKLFKWFRSIAYLGHRS